MVSLPLTKQGGLGIFLIITFPMNGIIGGRGPSPPQERSAPEDKIMASGPITSWQIDGETVEIVKDFILGGSKITADGD